MTDGISRSAGSGIGLARASRHPCRRHFDPARDRAAAARRAGPAVLSRDRFSAALPRLPARRSGRAAGAVGKAVASARRGGLDHAGRAGAGRREPERARPVRPFARVAPCAHAQRGRAADLRVARARRADGAERRYNAGAAAGLRRGDAVSRAGAGRAVRRTGGDVFAAGARSAPRADAGGRGLRRHRRSGRSPAKPGSSARPSASTGSTWWCCFCSRWR